VTARELVGLLALTAVLVALGLALLHAAGLVRRSGDAGRAAGLAIVLGWATTGLIATAELLVGLRATLAEVLVAQGLVAAAALVAGRRIPELRSRPGGGAPRSPLAAASAAIFAVYLAGLVARSLVPRGIGNNDVWSQWLVKAKVIYFLGLDTGVGGYTSQANGSYPPLDPALESTAWHFAGSPDFLALPFLHTIVFVAFVGALAYLLAPRVPPALLWPSLAMLALAPKLAFFVGSSLADEPLALFLALAALLGALWLLDDEPRWLGLACLFLATATLTKNEGTVTALILALLLAAGARRRQGVLLLAAPLVAELPWKLWSKLNDVHPTFSYEWDRLVHPHRLADRADYLTYGGRSLLDQLLAPSHWLLIVPAVLALGVLAGLRRNPLALVAVGFPILTFAAFELTYWVGADVCTWSPGYPCDGTWHDILWLVGASADRIPVSIVVVCGALFPLLVVESGATFAGTGSLRARWASRARPRP
jgi:hypothetical protein